MFRLRLLFVLVISLCLFFIGTISLADDYKYWNSARDYEPITFEGKELELFLGESVFQLFAYSYNQSEDKWTQIPLQIDEQDDSSHVWVPSPNNILDDNDDLVFMARDMGDLASDRSIWIDDIDSKKYVRYEITATDYNDASKLGYAYIYLSSTLQDTVSVNYMSYTEAAPGTGSDVISGVTYVEGHNTAGIPDSLVIPISAGGNGIDLLDRQKARATSAFLGFPVEATEENLVTPSIEYVIGKVRVARRITFILELFGVPIWEVKIPMYYYPYSIDSKGASGTLSTDYKVEHIRQSFDLNSNASGMLFHNNFNRNIPIDGSQDDTVHTDLVFGLDVNWYMFTGNQGTILTLIKLTQLANDQLYYWDNSIGSSADGKEDTGDGESWGDVGILITGTALEGRFSIAYTSYYLSSNQLAAIGPQYAGNFQIPLQLDTKAVPVELSSFETAVKKGDVHLTWTTVSESNNYGFEIHRKAQNNETWEDIGFVEGYGTTNIPQKYSFADHNLSPNIYFYRLKQIDFNGAYEFSQTREVTVQAPNSFSLEQNYPNPFNPVTTIKYQIPKNLSNNVETVNLTIYNLLGVKIRTLVSTKQAPGFYTINWDGKDDRGNIVSTGMYVYRLQAGKYAATRRMVLMK